MLQTADGKMDVRSSANYLKYRNIGVHAAFLGMLLFIPINSHANISCKQYKENINELYKLIPGDLSLEEKCNIIPDKCGVSGLLFNPEGMKSYYYKSECFFKLAIQTLDEKYCNKVVERKALFRGGAYFSRESCLRKIRQIKSDAKAKKVKPKDIHRIQSLRVYAKGKELEVEVFLTDGNVTGKYALSFLAHYTEKGTDITAALNPQAPEIKYDKSFERFRPVNHWILEINNSQKQINFKISKTSYSIVRKFIDKGGRVKFSLSLQFLQSNYGEIADTEKRNEYISAFQLNFPDNQGERARYP